VDDSPLKVRLFLYPSLSANHYSSQASTLTWRTTAVVDQESGYLLGYNIKDERGNLIRFEKVQKVPIAES
jgi:outer membrane lipoprotein-sorting protein